MRRIARDEYYTPTRLCRDCGNPAHVTTIRVGVPSVHRCGRCWAADYIARTGRTIEIKEEVDETLGITHQAQRGWPFA